MKILHIAKHGVGKNDDEGAIAYALRKLGHDVVKLYEGHTASLIPNSYDFVLFHKWHDPPELERLSKQIPFVFWYFDRVFEPDDPTVAGRNRLRMKWMEDTLPHVRLGFCTDGDWVARDQTDKLRWLPQGADGRVVGLGTPIQGFTQDILFCGLARGNGKQRLSFYKDVLKRYRSRFLHVQSGLHGRYLADTIASAKVVLAPDGPISDRYWSNRIYLTLGFGGVMLHPRCEWLEGHYQHGMEILYYDSREDLWSKIEWALGANEWREQVRQDAYERTVTKHLYEHRCAELIKQVKERL